ncbi:hypothetical protein GCM10029978_067290 [Actinoallomurus acanthiterrae]
MLTKSEHEAVDLAGKLYTLIVNNVIEHGECFADDEREIRRLIHGIQRAVEAQAAVRTSEPGQYRFLGLSLEESARAMRSHE